MPDISYSPEQLLNMHETGGLSIRRIEDATGIKRDKVHRMILAALAARTQAKAESVKQAIEAGVGSEPEPVYAEVAPEQLAVALEPGQVVSREDANRLYLACKSFGEDAVAVHIAEMFRLYDRARLSSRAFVVDEGPNARGWAVLPTFRGRLTDEQIEQRMTGLFRLLDYLAAGHDGRTAIVPNPPENHLWKLRVTYADGTTGEEETVVWLQDPGVWNPPLLDRYVHTAVFDMRQAAATEHAQDERKLISSATFVQRQPPSDAPPEIGLIRE